MKMGIKLLGNGGPKVNKNRVTDTGYGHFVYWTRVLLKQFFKLKVQFRFFSLLCFCSSSSRHEMKLQEITISAESSPIYFYCHLKLYIDIEIYTQARCIKKLFERIIRFFLQYFLFIVHLNVVDNIIYFYDFQDYTA